MRTESQLEDIEVDQMGTREDDLMPEDSSEFRPGQTSRQDTLRLNSE